MDGGSFPFQCKAHDEHDIDGPIAGLRASPTNGRRFTLSSRRCCQQTLQACERFYRWRERSGGAGKARALFRRSRTQVSDGGAGWNRGVFRDQRAADPDEKSPFLNAPSSVNVLPPEIAMLSRAYGASATWDAGGFHHRLELLAHDS